MTRRSASCCPRALVLAALLVATPAAPQPVQSGQDTAKMSADARRNLSGLPVPRFMSLRAGRANLRAGPGTHYPARWALVRPDGRPGVPLEVIAEWNVWRQVRDPEGETGWLDRAMLSTERTFLVTGETRTLRARPDLAAPAVWRAAPGVVGNIITCAERWCRIEVEGRSGWILREQGFGTYPNEAVGN